MNGRRPRSIPPRTSTGPDLIESVRGLIERVPELAKKMEELKKAAGEQGGDGGEGQNPFRVETHLGGHILGRPIGNGGGGQPGGGEGLYGDDPEQHTDRHGAGYGNQRFAGAGAGGIKRSTSPAAKKAEAPAEAVPDVVEKPKVTSLKSGAALTFSQPAEGVEWEQKDDVLEIEHAPSNFSHSVLLKTPAPVELAVKRDGTRYEWRAAATVVKEE